MSQWTEKYVHVGNTGFHLEAAGYFLCINLLSEKWKWDLDIFNREAQNYSIEQLLRNCSLDEKISILHWNLTELIRIQQLSLGNSVSIWFFFFSLQLQKCTFFYNKYFHSIMSKKKFSMIINIIASIVRYLLKVTVLTCEFSEQKIGKHYYLLRIIIKQILPRCKTFTDLIFICQETSALFFSFMFSSKLLNIPNTMNSEL